MKDRVFSALDIGSNAIRFKIAAVGPEKNIKSLCFIRVPLRLGHYAFNNLPLDNSFQEKLILSFQSFYNLALVYGSQSILAVATSAMRSLNDSQKLIAEIKNKTKVEIKTIDAIEEASISILPVIKNQKLNKNILHIDIGGGSSEFSFIKGGKAVISKSFDIGTVRMKNGRQDGSVFLNLNKFLTELVKAEKIDSVSGSGGAWDTTLQVMDRLLNQKTINVKNLTSLIERTKKLKANEIAESFFIEYDKAEVFLEACQIEKEILQAIAPLELNEISGGLIDGLILKQLND